MDDQQRAALASRLSTARPPSLSPMEALSAFWRKAFTYSGRASRAEYNWALGAFLVCYCSVGGAIVGTGLRNSWGGAAAVAVFLLVFLVPWCALIARRCHDMNRPGAFGLLLLATGIGFLVTECLLMFSDSDPRGVRFDPPPAPLPQF